MARLLRLVGPGQDPPAPRHKGRPAPSLSLTPDEARRLRASIRNVARTFGSFTKLARALGVGPGILTHKRPPGPGLAVALWRLTGTPLDVLLRGRLEAAPAPSGSSGGAS